jgi:hypothetical protein
MSQFPHQWARIRISIHRRGRRRSKNSTDFLFKEWNKWEFEVGNVQDFEFGVAPRPGEFKYPQPEGLDAGAMKKPRHFARLRSNPDFF